VHIATALGAAAEQIKDLGLNYHQIHLSRSGTNPFSELKSLISIYRLFNRLRPDLVHLVTIKPVLYGGVIARLIKIPCVVAAISGLGSVFIATTKPRKLLRYLVLKIYRVSLGHKNIKVIFQNPDDRNILVSASIIPEEETAMIRGSGVDLSLYPVNAEPEGIPIVVMAARLLKEKGVLIFVEAVRIVISKGIDARFLLVGAPDPGNPSSVTEAEVEAWVDSGVIEALGFRQDIPRIFSGANIVVLPSFREGLPKVLIEAAACARPVITTDSPGCRDAIEAGVTGLLVPPQDPQALAEALEQLISDPSLRIKMGHAGRKLAEREFRIESVIASHLSIYQALLEKHKIELKNPQKLCG
jgi:glycosyltransferase involved in cell wall biosynthesis